MLDLSFQDTDFTWSNGKVKKRLDRGFCNADWRFTFPEAKIVHLSQIPSNHCLVLVQLQSSPCSPRINPTFWFQAMWMQHKDYYTSTHKA